MDRSAMMLLLPLAYIALFALITWRLIRRRKHYGPGAAATMEELLTHDRRQAVEIILEEKAAARDPETADDEPTAGTFLRR